MGVKDHDNIHSEKGVNWHIGQRAEPLNATAAASSRDVARAASAAVRESKSLSPTLRYPDYCHVRRARADAVARRQLTSTVR